MHRLLLAASCLATPLTAQTPLPPWPSSLPAPPIALPAPDADASTLRAWLTTHGPALLDSDPTHRVVIRVTADTLVLETQTPGPSRVHHVRRLPLRAVRLDTLFTASPAAVPLLDESNHTIDGVILAQPGSVRSRMSIANAPLMLREQSGTPSDRLTLRAATPRRAPADARAAILALARTILQLARTMS